MEEAFLLLWIGNLARRCGLKLRCLNNGFFFSYKHANIPFTRWTGVMWILVEHCDVFISCLDSLSDGTHSTAEDLFVSKVI